LKAIVEVELAILDAELVNELRTFDVEAAVLGDVDEATLAPPADGIQSVAGFADAERCRRDGIQTDAMPERFLEVDE
jgi:hypothetical protein